MSELFEAQFDALSRKAEEIETNLYGAYGQKATPATRQTLKADLNSVHEAMTSLLKVQLAAKRTAISKASQD